MTNDEKKELLQNLVDSEAWELVEDLYNLECAKMADTALPKDTGSEAVAIEALARERAREVLDRFIGNLNSYKSTAETPGLKRDFR